MSRKITAKTILETVKTVESCGSFYGAAKILGVPRSTVRGRIAIYDRLNGNLTSLSLQNTAAHGRAQFEIDNGYIIIGSDAHYWPGVISTAHRAFVMMCRELKPTAVVLNGDMFDGASISRFPRIGWDKKPTVKQEVEAVKERLQEIADACGTRNRFWPLGNHDARYETFLAAHASEFEGMNGFHLRDHFPDWKPCWSLHVNDDLVIKHRYKGGTNAPFNNTREGGRSMVTGHMHSQKVHPYSDYNGTRWGVDCGTMADPYGDQFNDYTEDNPVDWRSGFCVIRYKDGKMLAPQLLRVIGDGVVEFGLEIFTV